MFNCDEANSPNLRGQAECEMAAFLKAADVVLGPGGHWLAAEAWLRTMESLNWPKGNYQKFFRSVSIRAISEIVADSDTSMRTANPGSTE